MMKTIRGTAVALAICVVTVLAEPPPQNKLGQAGGLDCRIGAANASRYKAVHDAGDWRNPYLIIRREGIEVIAQGLPLGRTIVRAGELQKTLIQLPLIAWPYGRVVGMQDIGLRDAGDESYESAIADNRKMALAILEQLNVNVERWPSS